MTDQDLDREEFKAWLEAQAPGCEVGVSGDGGRCPIARFICNAGPDVSYVAVSHDEIEVESLDGDDRIKPPAWATAFVEAIDGSPLDEEGWPRCLPVTREAALAVLEGSPAV